MVSSPSTPTGPRACIRLVEIPTSAPSPNRYPSLKRVVALWLTQAASTRFKNCSAVSVLSAITCERHLQSIHITLYSCCLETAYLTRNVLLELNQNPCISVHIRQRSDQIIQAPLTCSSHMQKMLNHMQQMSDPSGPVPVHTCCHTQSPQASTPGYKA